MSIVLRVNGKHESCTPKNGKDYDLDELYKLLNCELIEVVYLRNTGCILIVDEEGAVTTPTKEINIYAKRMFGLTLFGDVMVCLDNQLE